MREGIPEEVLYDAAGYRAHISAWRGGEVTAESVPVMGGRLDVDGAKDVPEWLRVTVPRFDGRDWWPANDTDHPLSAYGQQLELSIIVTSARTSVEYETRIGRYQIQSATLNDDGSIDVEAAGLMQIIADARLETPLAPRPTGTLVSELGRLIPDGLVTQIDDALTDRRCPQSFEWAEDRLGALYEIADAWPAQMRTDEWGQITFRPPLPDIPKPVVWIGDGENGTVLGDTRTVTREGVYNVIVARSTATDDPDKPPMQAVSRQTTGPLAVSTFGAIVKFWSSPLVMTQAALQKSAETMRRNSLRPARVVPVTMVPDPRIDLDDPIALQRGDDPQVWGYVVAYSLPLVFNETATVIVGVDQ